MDDLSTLPRLWLEPLDDRVVVEPGEEEAETKTGLIIPASTDAGARSGIVTGVGPDVHGVEPGDKILFPATAGFEVRLTGTAVRILRRGEIIARVHD
jgi:chaperonin GroES